MDEDKIRNRVDARETYENSEFMDNNKKKKKPRNEISDSLDYKKRQLGGLGGLNEQ